MMIAYLTERSDVYALVRLVQIAQSPSKINLC